MNELQFVGTQQGKLDAGEKGFFPFTISQRHGVKFDSLNG